MTHIKEGALAPIKTKENEINFYQNHKHKHNYWFAYDTTYVDKLEYSRGGGLEKPVSQDYLDCGCSVRRPDGLGYPRNFQIYTVPGCCGVAIIFGDDEDFASITPEERKAILEVLEKKYASVIITTNEEYDELKEEGWQITPLGNNPKGSNLYLHTYILNEEEDEEEYDEDDF